MKLNSSKSPRNLGFALVATLLLLILLSLLAVGLLSLSSVALRSSFQGSAQAEARANARLALMIAIGELQKQMGADQRVSASGAIISDSSVMHPHWTGVWDSWQAGGMASGADTKSEHSTIAGASNSGMAPSYQAQRKDHFRAWLLSLNSGEANQVGLPSSLALSGVALPNGTADAVRLVGKGSLGAGSGTADYVSARLLPVKSAASAGVASGRYGWWVGDESQKARIMDDPYEAIASPTAADKIFRQQSPGSTGTSTVKGLESISATAQLNGLPSLQTLDLVRVGTTRGKKDPKPSENFHSVTPFSRSVIADVREGGLKRDLNTLLEQPIDLANQGPEYMLYEFDDPRFPFQNNPNDARRANSRVPIQDLAAYYQLYDHQPAFENGRRGGVQYSSSALSNSLQVNVPDYDGGIKANKLFNREYTSLYRRPVVTKIQFLVGATAQTVTQAERDWVKGVTDGTVTWGGNNDDTRRGWGDNMEYMRDTDTLKLKLGIQPMVTLWNPSNLPLVMQENQILCYGTPPLGIKIRKYRNGGQGYDALWMNLGYANNAGNGTSNGQGGGKLLYLRLGNNTITFEPGEVKVFSIPNSTAAYLTDDGVNERDTLALGSTMEVVNEWDPFGVFLMKNSAPVGHYASEIPEVYPFDNNRQMAQTLVLSPDDRITISIESESARSVTDRADGRNASRDAEIKGAAFSLYMLDEGYKAGHWSTWADSLRHDIMISRHGSQTNPNRLALGGFYEELMLPGFPGGTGPIEFDGEGNAISGTQLEAAGKESEIIALMDFSLSVGSEASSAASGGFGGGRRVTSRPFLHSSTAAMPFIAQSEKDSLYDYGWDWQVSKINTVEDSIMQAKPGTGNGYYGGGYTIENGTTHVIQSEVPVLPPISIASLSHAYLGGFSMAKAIPVGENPDTDKFWEKSAGNPVNDPTGVSFQRATASGQNGLAPQIVQAIGNSYAHPNIPAEKAFVSKTRTFDLDEGSFDIPYVDHSYLANKALWDEFFFSSIAPQPSKVPLYGGTNRTAKDVAGEFFRLNDPRPPLPLPNRRMQPYASGLDQTKLDALFAQANTFTGGMADKIAANLMITGAFNINSTSVEAWKVFFSSLKGKPAAYLDGGTTPKEATTTGTAVGPNSLPGAAPIKTASISSPNSPPEQWKSARELTPDEIEELAEAMVKQVKLRGPFLSLSEFVNRRLDGSKKELALKGALQAALDDPDVSINAPFRQSNRMLDSETAGIEFAFPEAAKGPIAYGSAAYVDQADLLRNFAEQLTPRGDTFVIRAYGDSLDPAGNVLARAWCEAVVQRVPNYVDGADENHIRTALLTSEANKQFGRKFQIVGFRWLNSDEV
jgi:type II secretory pathway pseudopilin PulG